MWHGQISPFSIKSIAFQVAMADGDTQLPTALHSNPQAWQLAFKYLLYVRIVYIMQGVALNKVDMDIESMERPSDARLT